MEQFLVDFNCFVRDLGILLVSSNHCQYICIRDFDVINLTVHEWKIYLFYACNTLQNRQKNTNIRTFRGNNL